MGNFGPKDAAIVVVSPALLAKARPLGVGFSPLGGRSPKPADNEVTLNRRSGEGVK